MNPLIDLFTCLLKKVYKLPSHIVGLSYLELDLKAYNCIKTLSCLQEYQDKKLLLVLTVTKCQSHTLTIEKDSERIGRKISNSTFILV